MALNAIPGPAVTCERLSSSHLLHPKQQVTLQTPQWSGYIGLLMPINNSM
uniref:Uncharacterized protein n=1 Tax=Arundo donax TaxID=35708 RepID=A0A0A9EID4_ARUDO